MKNRRHERHTYSYIRFSTTVQGKDGKDSRRRQTDIRDGWLTAHPTVKLDTLLRMTDAGVSGFTGAHRSDKACLGAFVKLVEAGRIAKGSYLLVENLDRLSREEVQDGLELLLSLVRHGIIVVQLMPSEVEFRYPADPMRLMMAVMELNRGNSESAVKSERLGKLWTNKRVRAEAGEKVRFRLPGWITRSGESLKLNQHAPTVRRLFALLVDGYGCAAIAKKFNTEKVETFGTVPYWCASTRNSIATRRAAVGDYQPRTSHKTHGKRVNAGAPIANYYPPAIDEATWLKANAAIKSRTGRRGSGRIGRVNLFTGLVQDGVSGSAFHLNCGTRSNLMEPYFNRGAKSEGACSASFPVEVFELAMIREMGNLSHAPPSRTTVPFACRMPPRSITTGLFWAARAANPPRHRALSANLTRMTISSRVEAHCSG